MEAAFTDLPRVQNAFTTGSHTWAIVDPWQELQFVGATTEKALLLRTSHLVQNNCRLSKASRTDLKFQTGFMQDKALSEIVGRPEYLEL